MKQATYDIANIGHFGLASKAYLHFTSPIRRYPDLVVHRIVHEVLSGRDARHLGGDEWRSRLAESAMAASVAERRAMEVERAVVDLYRAFMMKDRIGAQFEGTVTGVVGSGVFVQLDAPFVDVLVRLEDLGQDRWEVDDDALRVVAARSGEVIALGERIRVEIVDVSILRRTVYGRRAAGAGERVVRRGKKGREKGRGERPKAKPGRKQKQTAHTKPKPKKRRR